MRSKHFIGLILAAAIVSAIYFFRDELFSTPEVSSWDFVPNSAAIIFESEDPIGIWNKFIETDHWKNLSTIEDINKLNTSLALLDSILGKEGLLDDIVKNEKSLVSLHIISSSTWDFVFYISLNNPSYQENFLQILDYFKMNRPGFSMRRWWSRSSALPARWPLPNTSAINNTIVIAQRSSSMPNVTPKIQINTRRRVSRHYANRL